MQSNYRHRILSLYKNVWLIHSARTAIAATIALSVATLFKLPEAYWAPISAIIVTQSTLGASWEVSKQRLIGTAMGTAFAGVLASFFTVQPIIFGAGIFVIGLICGMLRLEQSAYRFAGVTFAIVMLVTHGEAAWLVGLQRFLEVSVGISVALGFSAIGSKH